MILNSELLNHCHSCHHTLTWFPIPSVVIMYHFLLIHLSVKESCIFCSVQLQYSLMSSKALVYEAGNWHYCVLVMICINRKSEGDREIKKRECKATRTKWLGKYRWTRDSRKQRGFTKEYQPSLPCCSSRCYPLCTRCELAWIRKVCPISEFAFRSYKFE